MLRLGLIGCSEGNGHPYSWSAILNGYDAEAMARCPFPAIPRYLAERSFPRDGLPGARVTHVWTQRRAVSDSIARASLIEHVVDEPEAMMGQVDGVLLARDDAENHRRLAGPFLAAGLPIYIDKPLATSVAAAEELLALARRPAQVFSCSALRYARELELTADVSDRIGPLEEVEARSPKIWATYAAHVIEPVLAWLPLDVPESTGAVHEGAQTTVGAAIGRVRARFITTGEADGDITIEASGSRGSSRLVFDDAFSAFRGALAAFLEQMRTGVEQIPRDQTLSVVRLIEAGSRV
jgi:Oxidoreductase family, NAD-binding Rossmann fold